MVGLGSPDRGDDGVGPAVAQAVAARAIHDVDVVPHVDPSELLHVMNGYHLVIVVDAVASGGAPGAVAVLETPPPGAGTSGTHDLGLAEVIALARALGRLPPRLLIVAVEAIDFGHGRGLSPAVEAAVPRAVEAVVLALG